MIFRKILPLALGLMMLAGGPVLAQSASGDATLPPLGTPFVDATFADWEILCTQIDEAGAIACEMYQLLNDGTGSPIAEISIAALPFGSEVAAGATVTAPLETFLPSGLGWRIGDAEEMRIEQFRVCNVVGCFVRMGLTVEEVDAMKAGSNATVVIAPFVAIDQPIEINVSLSGFTAAYEDLQTRLAEAAIRMRENQ
tara:strand:- start:1318 stop:1908 length:591 start_codon:yes stop_codon:yes gene_type:complete